MHTIDEAVNLLVEARRSGQPADAPTLADDSAAYAVQDGVGRALGWFAEGTAPRYWKSGGPSRSAVLTHAPLPPGGVWVSPAKAGNWPLKLRGLEAELALRLGRDVDAALAATLDVAGATALIDAMCVSIELVESRWVEGLDAPALAKLADLQSHSALVLGEWQPFAVRDWSSQVCRVRIGTQPEMVFRGSQPLADPAFALPVWLRHATRHGATLAAGTVVTSGTWCGILRAKAGDAVDVLFEGIGRASVQL